MNSFSRSHPDALWTFCVRSVWRTWPTWSLSLCDRNAHHRLLRKLKLNLFMRRTNNNTTEKYSDIDQTKNTEKLFTLTKTCALQHSGLYGVRTLYDELRVHVMSGSAQLHSIYLPMRQIASRIEEDCRTSAQ